MALPPVPAFWNSEPYGGKRKQFDQGKKYRFGKKSPATTEWNDKTVDQSQVLRVTLFLTQVKSRCYLWVCIKARDTKDGNGKGGKVQSASLGCYHRATWLNNKHPRLFTNTFLWHTHTYARAHSYPILYSRFVCSACIRCPQLWEELNFCKAPFGDTVIILKMQKMTIEKYTHKQKFPCLLQQ